MLRVLAEQCVEQDAKFKGLQRLVAEFVVEKNNEIEQLKQAVADLQVSKPGLEHASSHAISSRLCKHANMTRVLEPCYS